MYKNIIFDLGNVLLTFDPEEYLNKLIDNKNIIPILYNAIFKSDEWPMLDRGTITQEEAKLAGLSTILFKSPSDLSEKLGNMLDNM